MQKLLPTAEVAPTRSHTYRNEQIKEYYWENGVQYGPCAAGVHNDHADFVADDGSVVEKFTEIEGALITLIMTGCSATFPWTRRYCANG